MLGGGGTSHMDDEYRWAGVEDPKIMITTSHDPSSRLKMFVKVMTCHIFIFFKSTFKLTFSLRN